MLTRDSVTPNQRPLHVLNAYRRQRNAHVPAKSKSNSERKESHDLAEAVVYDDAILDAVRKSPTGEKVKMTPVELPVEYYKAAGEQARKRVVAAGLRLVVVLNELAHNDTRLDAKDQRR